MLRTILSVDERSASAFSFAVFPKIGAKICRWEKDAFSYATIVGIRREIGEDGSCMLLVSARSA